MGTVGLSLSVELAVISALEAEATAKGITARDLIREILAQHVAATEPA